MSGGRHRIARPLVGAPRVRLLLTRFLRNVQRKTPSGLLRKNSEIALTRWRPSLLSFDHLFGGRERGLVSEASDFSRNRQDVVSFFVARKAVERERRRTRRE